jgi:hypothetical protein
MITTGAVTCVVGGVLGSSQAIALRGRLRSPLWWIVATIIGAGIGLAAGVVVVEQVGIFATGNRPNIAQLNAVVRAASLVGVGLIAGIFLGVAQWLVLRVQIPQVKYWVLASGCALATAFSASSLLVDLAGFRIASASGGMTFVLLSGAAFGLMTSWPLRDDA